MPDYQQGRIYTIRCLTDETLIYVGSTTQDLYKRLYFHKKRSITNNHILLYRTINNNWNNWKIELYELYPCNSKEELCRKEGEIQRLISTLNTRIEGRTATEYNLYYREKNKDKLNEKIICICGCISTKNNISTHLKSIKHAELTKVEQLTILPNSL